MKNLILLAFTLFSVNMFSQNFKISYDKQDRLYLYQNNYYKYHELKPVLSQFEDSSGLYKDFKTVDNIGNVFLIGGITLSVIGFAGIKPPEHCDFICEGNQGAFISLLVGIPTTGVGLVIKLINLGNKKDPIEAFNNHYSNDLSGNKEIPELEIIAYPNGLGFRLGF